MIACYIITSAIQMSIQSEYSVDSRKLLSRLLAFQDVSTE
jgi:hypothetical protein